MSRFIFVDISRCIYCRSCEVACAREHGGRSHMSVMLVDERYSVPLNCRHCEKMPCAAICLPKAIAKNERGVVSIDPAKCNGCRLCPMVCPFGAIQMDAVTKVAKICDLCQSRLEEGEEPACVTTCPARALIYDEFDSVVERLKEKAATAIVRGTELRLGFLLKPT